LPPTGSAGIPAGTARLHQQSLDFSVLTATRQTAQASCVKGNQFNLARSICERMVNIFSLTVFLGFIAVTCGAAEQLAPDPVAAVRKALPKTWTILKIEDHIYPTYRPKGDGKAIFLGITDKKYSKAQYSAVLYIMPSDYADGGVDPTHGQAQTVPARLVATTSDARIYLWPPAGVEEWKTMQEDLLKAIIKK
jgi:hypothetical protein